jgi:hypothetical protein
MASIIKADNIQKVSDGTNIIKKCGSTITLGSCGATIALACGASQTGFGQTYSASLYCTTVKTAPFTAVAGKGYFVNSTSGAITVTLPATPTVGDIISLKDYGGTWQTNNVTLCGNSSKINGICATASLNTKGQSISLIYVDSTKGWQDIQDSSSDVTGGAYITATGGTITTCGDYKIHTFTADGTFCVSSGGGNLSNVDYLIIAGGGAGGTNRLSGGGGAGGYRESHTAPVSGCYTASPLASSTPLGPFSPGAYPVTVGAGGSGATGPTPSNPGSNSSFSTITSAGGGAGAGEPGSPHIGYSGGSGGGSSTYSDGLFAAGNTPPVNPPQGQPGSDSGTAPDSVNFAGGGGGAGAAGAPGDSTSNGGAGVSSSITGSSVTRAGGGGGGRHDPATQSSGGTGGGAAGRQYSPGQSGYSGTANTGGGGGGLANGTPNGSAGYGGPGGSGIVVIRYKFQ